MAPERRVITGRYPVWESDPIVRVDPAGLKRLLVCLVAFVPKEAAEYMTPDPALAFKLELGEVGFLQTEDGPLRVVVEVTGEDD
jgi:hypothetical protein